MGTTMKKGARLRFNHYQTRCFLQLFYETTLVTVARASKAMTESLCMIVLVTSITALCYTQYIFTSLKVDNCIDDRRPE